MPSKTATDTLEPKSMVATRMVITNRACKRADTEFSSRVSDKSDDDHVDSQREKIFSRPQP